MKKYCVILLIFNLICLSVLLIQRYGTGKNQNAYSKAVDVDREKGAQKKVQHGGMDDEIYSREEGEHPRIAITFDDGPSAEWTPKLLDGLKKRGVRATFFVIGEKVEQNSAIIKRMKEEGHIIGNHTFTHVQLTALPQSEACEEIIKTNEALHQVTGEYTQYIRPPFGSWSDTLECGIELFPVMWTIDTLDWTTKNTDKVVRKAVRQAKDNSIILLHDIYDTSVDAALRIIDELQAQGYEFVTVEELLID